MALNGKYTPEERQMANQAGEILKRMLYHTRKYRRLEARRHWILSDLADKVEARQNGYHNLRKAPK